MEEVSEVFKNVLSEHKENMYNLLQIVVKFYGNDLEVLSLVYNHESDEIQIHHFDLFVSTLKMKKRHGQDIEFKYSSKILFIENSTETEIIKNIADSCGYPLFIQIITVMNPLL
jgi:hypothetical protein